MSSTNSNMVGNTLEAMTSRWWLVVVRGFAAILFGVLALAAPAMSALALILMWGVYAIANGVLELVFAGSAKRAGAKIGWYVVGGLVSIAAGVVAFVYPAMTGLVLLYVIATWAIVTGVVEIALAIDLRRVITNEWRLGLAGLLSIAFGVALFVSPGAGALAVVWLIAAYAMVFGVLLVALGVKLHQLHRDVEHAMPGTPKPA